MRVPGLMDIVLQGDYIETLADITATFSCRQAGRRTSVLDEIN